MSIETDLNRIATSMEEIVKAIRSSTVSLGNPGKTEAVIPKQAKTPKNVPNPPVVEEDFLKEAETEITQDAVHEKLQGYMEKNGVDGVKALMIKHGANKVKPTITSIPPANYKALMAEIG